MKTIQCPWCGTSYQAHQMFTYIIYTCDTCFGGFKRVNLGRGDRTVRVCERPPTEGEPVTETENV